MSPNSDSPIPIPRAWAADYSPSGLLALARDGVILYANQAAARILGCTDPDELVGRDAREFHPVPDVALSTAHDHLLDGRVRGLELVLRREDGSDVRTRIHADILEDGRGGAALTVTLEDVSEARSHAERDAQGRTMSAVGRLAGGMAHHFNNLLGSILANVSLLRGDGGDEEDTAEGLDQIEVAARRASDIADLLLLVSGRRIEERSELNAAAWIYAAAGEIQSQLPPDTEVVVRSEGGPLPVRVNESRLLQAVSNLVRNAVEALTAGGHVLLESREVTLEGAAGEPAFVPPAAPGRYVSIEVADSGLGMNAEILSRVLEPFFSTRRDREGAGLGLSTVYGIVAQMDGHLLVESEPLVGTRVRLIFPRADRAAPGQDTAPILDPDSFLGGLDAAVANAAIPSGETAEDPGPEPAGDAPVPEAGEDEDPYGDAVILPAEQLTEYDLVLVVDDEDSVRRVMEKILRRAGYRVVSASNGREAQRVFLENESELALMVTDIMMPELNGIDLASWARDRIPDLPVLLVSGFSESPLVQDWIDLEPGTFLAKPFEPEDLLRMVSARVALSAS